MLFYLNISYCWFTVYCKTTRIVFIVPYFYVRKNWFPYHFHINGILHACRSVALVLVPNRVCESSAYRQNFFGAIPNAKAKSIECFSRFLQITVR